MSGWIKMHRQMLETPELMANDAKGVWVALLLRAAHRPRSVLFRRQPVRLERGQLAVSVHGMASAEDIGHKRLRCILDTFENANMIKMDKAQGKAFTRITICNYDKYQCLDDAEGKAADKARAKPGQREQEREELENRFLPPSPSGSTPLGRGVAGRASGSAKDGSRGTRIPDDWKPSKEGIAYAVELLGSDLTNETWITFRDYWRAKAGREARKVSWPLTWKTWVRREHERLRERQARDERWRKSA